MDPQLLGLLPAGSVGSILAIIIIYLLSSNRADRKQYREDIARIEAEHVAEIKALTERHIESNALVRAELAEVTVTLKEVRQELEAERQARWKAEDNAAAFKRELDILRRPA